MTIKEILAHIDDRQIRQRIINFLKSRGLNQGELIAVDLRQNPRLYVILQGDIYTQYVQVDEGNGLIFLNKSAKSLVESQRAEKAIDDFSFLKKILYQIASSYAFPKFIEITRQLKPPNQDPQKWTADIVKQGADFPQRFKETSNLITQLIEFQVKVRDFQNKLRAIINDYSNLMRDMIMFCIMVIDNIQDKDMLDQAVLIFSMYSEGASSAYRLSSHWHVDTEPPFLHTSDFLSKILFATSRFRNM